MQDSKTPAEDPVDDEPEEEAHGATEGGDSTEEDTTNLDQTQPMQALRLEKLDHFTIEARIGEGGMGIVYRAYDPDLHRSVAIKRVHPQYEGDEEYASRFLTEARAVAATLHPNIAQIFSIHARDDESPPYFVMEYVDGDSIEARVRNKGPIPLVEVLDIAIQAARGLQAAYYKGIVHRDVKPSNILLSRQGEVKLVDFGLARRDEDATQLTQAGIVLGTPHFVSPEQSQGHRVDHRSDIYSLGCTLYYALTGQEPFAGTTKVEVIVAHANEDAPHLDASFPRPINTVLQRMLAKNPDDRYQSYEQLLQELDSVRAESWGTERRSKARALQLVTVAVVVAAAVVGVRLLTTPAESGFQIPPERLFREIYHSESGQEWLAYVFTNPNLQRFFRYSSPSQERFPPSRPPVVEKDQLRWRNFDTPIVFPYLARFDSIEISGLEFRGSPDFELTIGYNEQLPESRLRIFFGSDGRPNSTVIECWHDGERVSMPQQPRRVDFTLDNRTRYNIEVTRTSERELRLVIEQESGERFAERARLAFEVPDAKILSGAIALRSEGLQPQGWGVSIEEILIGGRLDRPRIGRSLLE